MIRELSLTGKKRRKKKMQCVKAYLAVNCYAPKLRPSDSSSESSKQFQRNPDSVSVGSEIPNNTPLLPCRVKSITSTSNPFVKHCVKLRQSSSYRNSHSSVLVLGSTPIREILRFQESPEQKAAAVECLILRDGAELPEEADGFPVSVVRASPAVMKRLCGLQSAESTELIALMRFPASFIDLADHRRFEAADRGQWFPIADRILVLDAIQDPGNLGTLIRSAMAFRWGGVYLLPGCCDPFNEKAVRASRGASFQLPMVSGGWAHLEALKAEFGMRMLAGHPAEADKPRRALELCQGLADSLAGTPLGLIVGSEGMGLSERARRECELVSIPMAGRFESLNVSVAGGIFLYALQPRSNT